MSSSNADNNNTPSNNGVFGNSLIDDATLVKSLTDSPSPLGIKPASSNSGNYDPFASINEDTNSKNKTDQISVVKPIEQPSVFTQPNVLPVTQPTSTSNKNTDPLTGNKQNTAMLGATTADPLTGSNNSALKTASTNTLSTNATTVIPNFAIRTEGTISMNGGGDYDGNPTDLSDDALIYAAKGFTINGNPTLPVQRDANGNPVRDASGKLVLVDKAVAVSSGYSVTNGPSNQYAGLIPPPVIPQQTVTVPAYADLKQQELNLRVPAGTPTVTFNSSQNPLNNANDWNTKFPSPGTASNPKVVRVTGGGLNIPSNITLNNYVITVDSGDINFNGNNHNFNNVVLITNNGNINLGNVQSRDLAVFSSGSINMNGGARFAGSTMLASGSNNGTINFNGATTTTNPTDTLHVVSQGDITYNGASNTRGFLLSVKNFIYNGNSTLYGTIGAKGNIIFNGPATVIYATDIPPDTTAPTITASLEKDTARNNTTNTDKITSDPTIVGAVTDTSSIAEFKAGFNSTPTANFTSVLTQRNADGSFRLTRSQLEQINGGTLADGIHTLKLQAKDASGNTTSVYEFTFTLDTTEAAPSNLDLTATTDSGKSDTDNITNNTTPSITGNANAGALVQLSNSGQVIASSTADSTGKWQITSSTLTNGTYNLTATATDIAGNVSTASQPLSITIDTVAPISPTLKLTAATDTGTDNSDGITKNNTPIIAGTAEANSTVKLYKDGQLVGTTNASVNGEWQVQLGTLANGNHVFTATATDTAGNISAPSTQYTVTVDTQINPPSNLDLITPSDSGISNLDNITKVTTPVITGNADANTTVQLFNAGQIVGQATTGSDGKWQITTNNLDNGTYNLSAQASDIAGNVSTPSSPLQVIIDSALPQITLTTPIDTQPLQQDAKLTGNVDGTGSSVIALQYRFDNNAEIALPFSFTGVFDSNIDFTGISNGSHTLSIIATDTAGNIKTTQYNVTVGLNNIAPVITTSLQRDTAPGNVTNTDKITFDPTITGTVTNTSNVVEFKAGFDNLTAANFVDVLPYRNSNGSFTFDRAVLDTIYSASINGGTSAAVLPDGQHTLKLVAKDNYGNVSDNYEFTFTLDTTTPTPILSLVQTSDTGISPSDRITNDNTPTITGNGEVGAIVQLFNGTEVVGQTTVDTSGTWLLTTSELTDGVKSLNAIASDIAGNTSTSTPIGITVDTLSPQLTLTTPIESSPLQPGAKLTGNINGTGSPLTAFSYRFNSGTEIPVNFNAAGTFDQNLDFTGLGSGNYTLTITATDTAGNILTNQYNVTINLDIAAPVIMAALVRDTAANGTTNLDKITFDPRITGTVSDAGQVAEFKAGFDNTPVANFINVLPQRNADGTFSLTRTQLETINGGTLPDGIRTLKLIAKDAEGNQSDIYSFSFTLDTATPTPNNLDLPASKDTGVSNVDNITKNASPTITGLAEIGATVKLINNADGLLIGETTVDTSGIWQIDINNLDNGTYNLSAQATDIAGNVSTDSTPFTITIDSVAPTLTLTTPIDITPLQQGARFVGSANGTGSGIASITYRFNSSTDIPVVVNPDDSFNQQLDLTGLPNGNHILTVTTTDVAGNLFTQQYNVVVNIDSEAPIITASLVRDTAPGNATNSDRITNNPAIAGTVTDANRVVELLAGLNSTSVSSFVDITAQIQANGSFTLDNSALAAIYNATNSGNSSNNSIPDGTYTLRLVAKDEFGNTSPTKEYTFTLDTTTPTPTNLDLPASIDSGLSATDNITNFNTPTITGNAEANSTVQLFNNGTVIGEATSNASGIWQIVTSDLTDGTYNLNAQATDIAGNISSISTPIQLIIDRALPQLNLTTPVDTAPLATGAKLIGNVDGTVSGIASLNYRFDNSSEVSVTLDNTGNFNQQLDLSTLTSGSHVLTLVATDIAGNVKTISYNVTINNDIIPPVITAGLKNDTAPNGTINSNPQDGKLSDTPSESLRDRITYDPEITGFVTDTSSIASFKAGFNNQTAASFVDVFAQLNTDGSFNFNRTTLEAIYGGTIPDGAHTLRLIASDSYGNTENAFSFTFTLDTNIAQPTFNLDAASDSGTIGDNKTKFNTVTLTGLTEPGAILILEQTGANGSTSPVLGQNGTPLTVTADNTGKYNFTNVSLAGGNNTFTVRATDIAGNTSSFSTIIYRFSAPTAINITNNTVAENSAVGTVIGELSSIDPDSGDTHTYTLIDNAGGRFKLVDNKLQVANGTLLDFEANTQHTVIVRSTDKNGLSKEETIAIALTNVNEVPIFTSTPNNTTVESGSTFTYNITTADPDAGDTRTFNAVGLPTWLTFTDNGNGTAKITGTPNQNQLGLFNIAITATDAGGLKATQNIIIGSQITLNEETNFSPKRNFPLTIPATPSILTFKIDPSFDLTDTKFINDAFEVALVDANGISFVHAIGKGRNAFFNLTEGEPVGLGAGASYNSTTKTVSLNLTGVKPGNAELIFRLVNDDKDTTTSVRITDFALVAAPAGTVAATQTTFAPEIRPNAAPNFNALVDVSNSLAAQYQRSSFNADTKTLYADVAVRNIGSYSVDVPVLVAVKNISDPSVILRNPNGVTPDGIPYYDFTSLVASGKLNPNGESGSRSLAFYNPNGVQFTYELVVLAQLNVKPVIESKPVVEVIGGKEYRYKVKASDKNGDILAYKLLASPNGMSIGSETGLISWNTTASNKGNQSVVVEVSDGRGGVETQVFTLAVIDTPPNRPPVFTTTPVVDASINTEYKYDADAVDPDRDDLTYRLQLAPEGMTIDRNTGEIKWTPGPVTNFGDSVIGKINNLLERDVYTFGGVTGEEIYIDSLISSSNIWFKLVTPSKNVLVDTYSSSYEGFYRLTETGNYRIEIDGRYGTTGEYGFNVISLAETPIVELDRDITGVTNPGTEDDIYRFVGRKGQQLYFETLTTTAGAGWSLYDGDNREIAFALNGRWSDFEAILPADGIYKLVLKGSESFNVGTPYGFRIITPDIVTKTLPSLGSNSQPNTISGKIKEKGEKDIYKFIGTNGQQIYLDLVSAKNNNLNATIISPSGKNIFAQKLVSDSKPLTLNENGTYELIIDGVGDYTGNYLFNLRDIDKATAVGKDDNIPTGSLESGTTTHLYRITGEKGQRLYIDLLDGATTATWTLYSPGNEEIFPTRWTSALEFDALPGDGTYILAVEGNNDAATSYDFQVITPTTKLFERHTNTNNTNPAWVILNESNTIVEKGEQHIYTFTGTTGKRLFLDSLADNSNALVTLISPSGEIILSQRELTAAKEFQQNQANIVQPNIITLLETGVYKLIIDGYAESANESYNFQLLSLSNSEDITPDATNPTVASLTPGTAIKVYQFSGNISQRIYFDNQNTSPTSATWQLYGPSNEFIKSASLYDNFEAELIGTGTYYLVLVGSSDSTPVDYKIRLARTTTNPTPEQIALATSYSRTISKLGEQDTYIFTNTSFGQRLYFDSRINNANITAKILSPSNQEIWSGSFNADSNAPIQLLEPGTYRLIIDGEGSTTGSYTFQLTDLAGTTGISNLAFDTATNNTTLTTFETKFYRISGATGQQIKIKPTSLPAAIDLQLYASGHLPSGNSFYNLSSLTQASGVTLPVGGDYVLAVRNTQAISTSFNIEVSNLGIATGTNSGFGLKQDSVTPSQPDSNTFYVRAGTYFYFDNQTTNSDITFSILAADNSSITTLYAKQDSELIQASTSGNYKISVTGNGSYKYQLLDLTSAAISTLNPNGTEYTPQIDLNQTKVYKFTGSIGQRIYYDALSNSSISGTVQLYSPTGYKLYEDSLTNNSGLLTLTETGTYCLIIRGNEDSIISPKFRILDANIANNAKTVTFGNQENNTYNNPFQTNLYRINVTASQNNLYFNSLDSNFSTWTLYSPGGQVVYSYKSYDFEQQLAPGNYILAVRSDGELANSPFKVFASSQSTLNINNLINQRISGEISTPGERDIYTLNNNTPGKRLYFDGIDRDNNVRANYKLISPTGVEIFNQDIGTDAQIFTLDLVGEYRIVVDAQDADTGAYRFRILDVNTATILNPDVDVVSVVNPGETSIYRITANSGDNLYIASDYSGEISSWKLYEPGNKEILLNDSNQDGEIQIKASGTYLLALKGGISSDTNYTIRLSKPISVDNQLGVIGDEITGNLEKPGQKDTYGFFGTVGQRLLLDTLVGTPGINIIIESPAGAKINQGSSESESAPFTLNETGNYKIIVDGSFRITGNYNFRLLDLENATNLSNRNENLEETIIKGNANNLYSFTGIKGQRVYFDLDGDWDNFKNVSTWAVYGPGNQIIPSKIDDYIGDLEIELLADGTYTLIVGGNPKNPNFPSIDAEQYKFKTRFSDINPTPIKILELGQTIAGEITNSGEQDVYTFNGTSGQRLFFDALDKYSLDAPTFYVTLKSPSGNDVNQLVSFSDQEPFFLDATGEYQLIVDATNNVTGNYSFRLIDVSAASELKLYEEGNLDTVYSGTIADGQQNNVYQYTAAANEKLYFDLDGSTDNISWVLYGPNNQIIAFPESNISDFEVVIPMAGTYTLILGSKTEQPTDYKFRVVAPNPTILETFTFGNTRTGEITKPGDTDVYKFTGEVGQRIFFDGIGNNDKIRATLVSPSGIEISLGTMDTDSTNPITLIEAGAYRVIIDASNDNVGDYSFRISDLAKLTQLQDDTSLNSESVKLGEVNLYRLNCQVGQVWNLNITPDAEYWIGAEWKLYAPDNTVFASSNGSPLGLTNFAVPASGTYSLVVRSTKKIGDGDQNAVGYNISAADVTPNAIQASFSGGTPQGTISAGQTVSYSFQANAGTRIIFDDLGTEAYKLSASLRNPDGNPVSLADGTNFTNIEASGDTKPIFLTQTGIYTFEIKGNDATSVGNFKYRIIELPSQLPDDFYTSADYLELNVVHGGTLNTGYETKVYSFNGSVGQKIFFDGILPNSGNDSVKLRLISPSGSVIEENFKTSQDINPLVFMESGVYHLLLQGDGTEISADYKFRILNVADAAHVKFNQQIQDAITDGSQTKLYRIAGQAKQEVYFDFSNSNLSWQLFRPGDLRRETGSGLYPSVKYTLPYDGEYILAVSSYYNRPENFSFQIVPTQENKAIVVPGDGKAGGNEGDSLGTYRVQVDVRDGRGGNAKQNYKIHLNPEPANAAPTIITEPITRIGLNKYLPLYQYQVRAIDPDNNTLTYSLIDAPSGAVIDADTGLITWSPQTNGVGNYGFTAGVSDGRGGINRQNFSVEVFNALGEIRGTVWEDLNRNRIMDSAFVPSDSSDIVFIIDVSGSTGGRFVDWTTASVEDYADDPNLAILDTEIASAVAFNEQLIRQGRGDSATISLVGFSGGAGFVDLDPVTNGIQLTTSPNADKNNNGILDFREALNTLRAFGGTYFTPPLERAEQLFASLNTPSGQGSVIFLSDGLGLLDTDVVERIKNQGFNISAFGIGSNAGMNALRLIDPKARQLIYTRDIVDIFQGGDANYLTEPVIPGVTVYIDTNNNSILDGDEVSTITQADDPNTEINEAGSYQFKNLLPGTYQIRQILPNGYQLTVPNNGAYEFTVTENGETFRGNNFGFVKTVTEVPNSQPKFISNAPKIAKVGEDFTYNAKATDADADFLTYDLTLKPDGMAIDAKTGRIAWTPTLEQAGQKLDAIVRVRDGRGGVDLQYFQVDVSAPNNAPIFTSNPNAVQTAQINKLFQYQTIASDLDGDTITYELVSPTENFLLPDSVALDTATGLLTWTPTQLGGVYGQSDNDGVQPWQIIVRATDGKGGEARQTLNLLVSEQFPNNAPQIISKPRTSISLGNNYFYKINATDPDDDALTYTLDNAPTGMSINNGVLVWTPTANQFGNNSVVVRVSDGTVATTQSFSINVGNAGISAEPINRAPEITSTPEQITNLEREYQYNLSGEDADGDFLLWSLDEAPAGMIIDAQSGALRWQPRADQLGQHIVKVKLTDAYGAFVGQEFSLIVNGINTPPQINSTPKTIAAVDQPYTYQVIATDPEGEEITYSLGKSSLGMSIDSNGVIKWTPKLDQLQAYQVEVIATDKAGASAIQTYTVEVARSEVLGQVVPVAVNNAPTITSSPVFLAATNRAYSYQVVATDSDVGDTLTYQLIKGMAGMSINATTGLLSWNNPVAGSYEVIVGAVDAGGLGAAQRFTLTARSNNAPVINSTAVTNATLGAAYSYDVKAVDADGDRITYSLDATSLGKGMTLDNLGRLRWNPDINNVGSNNVVIAVTDGNGGSTSQSYNLVVAADAQAPKVSLIASYDLINQGETVTFQARATDNIKVASLKLLINGNIVALDANGLATVTATSVVDLNGVAIATDTSGNIGQSTFTVDVINPGDTSAPVINFMLEGIPEEGFVTAPTRIKATINDTEGLKSYRLLVAPIDGGEFKELWSNNNPTNLNNQFLDEINSKFKFDPSLLENDSYILRLEATDNNNNTGYVDQIVDVAGELKLGNFRLTFTDLAIPVTGIPITLTRTYDTLTTATRDDFGYGWRMEFRDTNLKTSLLRDENDKEREQYGYYKGFKRGTKVYITLPGGKREAFTFQPVLDPESANLPYSPETLLFYNPVFVGEKGSTSKLTVKDAQIFRSKESDGLFFSPASKGYNPADPYFGGVYELTTKDGTVYEIDASTGDLLTATDKNGNKLTYTDDGIYSSTGQKVTFERDAEERIVAVKDPMGELVKYNYDAKGDLISVIDQQSNETKLIYDTDSRFLNQPSIRRPHYLREIIDPLNRQAARVEYDDEGRLKQTVNAAGGSAGIRYDLENATQTVLDALGNPTTYEYDNRGNVTLVRDALGNETKMQYNDDMNMTEMRNPNGLVTKYEYDNFGNLKAKTEEYCGCPGVVPGKTYYEYDIFGNMTNLVLPTGASMSMTYDKVGNLLEMKDGKGNIIQKYTYYSSGLVRTEADSTGLTLYRYDQLGNVSSSLDFNTGETTSMEYDANGNLKKMIEDKGTVDTSDDETSTFTYDKLGRETYSDYGNGIWVKYDYTGAGGDWTKLEAPTIGKMERKLTADGKLAGWVTPDGGTPTFKYDAVGRLFRETDASGNDTTEYSYDAVGRLTSVKDLQTGAVTTKKYDAGGRVIEEVSSLKLFSRYNYNTRTGRLDSTDSGKYLTDANGNLVLDAQGKPVVDTTVDIRTYRYEYNGTTTTVIDPLGRRTTSVADDYYLPSETIYQLRDGQKLSEKTEYLYGNNLQEAKDYPTRVVDIAGRSRTFEYDAQGRLKSATDLGDNKYLYTYGDDGLSLITSPTGETLGYEYDALGNLASVKYGNATSKQMTYRASDNRLETVTLPSGETITYDYDDAGQVKTQVTKKNGVVTDSTSYTYTEDGAVNTITDSTGTTTYRYDASKRLAGMDYANGNSISYTYDTVGRVKTVAEKGSATGTAYTTEYDYDVFGNLKSIKDPSGGITTMKYDVVNRLKERTLPNGVKTTYEYDDLDRVKSIVHTNAQGAVLTSVTYERKGIGEPSQITREDGSYSKLEYDESLRVTKESNYNAAGTLLKETSYSYDASGKRLVQSSVDNTRTFNYTAGYQLDKVVETGETENYDYDQNGRLTLIERDGKTLDLEHDAYDRLTSVENETTGETTQYIYDGAGNRIKAVEGNQERRFLVAPAMGGGLESTDLITDGSGNLISNYIYGGGSSPFMRLDANGNAVYYLTDAMGTVIGLADGSGASTGKFLYDAFGNILNGSSLDAAAGGDFRFQGQWLESESGLYHFRARDYDSATGLFLSRDPVDIIETVPESFNPYQFVYNNPYIYSDPTGMISITEIQAAFTVQNILRSIETRTKQEIYERFKDKAVEVAGEVFWSVLKTFVPINSPLTDGVRALNSALEAGVEFERMFKRQVSDIFADAGINLDQLFLEVGVTQDGQATGNWINFPNIEANVRAGELRPDYVLTPPGNQPRGRRGVQVTGGPQRSYLIGDIKLQLKTIVNTYIGSNGKAPENSRQWDAIANYARKNGSRVAGFITLFGDSKKGSQQSFEQIAQKAAIRKGFIVFIASILQGVPYSQKP